MTLKGDAKLKVELTRGLKIDIRNLTNFHASSWKYENLHSDALVFSKAYKVLNEKLQKIYVSWHWRVMQSLKKNWLLVSKITLKNDQKKANSWEICILCHVIDLKQSLEGTLKVWEKSLTTALHEVYFVVNLYSPPLPLVPQANPSFPKISHFPPSQAEQFPKLPLFFC